MELAPYRILAAESTHFSGDFSGELLLAFLVHELEVEVAGRLLVEERAFLRASAADVDVPAWDGDIGTPRYPYFLILQFTPLVVTQLPGSAAW